MILRQFANVAGCVRSFMLAQKYKIGISGFWPKLTVLLEQQIILFRLNKSLFAYRRFHKNRKRFKILYYRFLCLFQSLQLPQSNI